MKTVYNLLVILGILTIVTMASNGFMFGLLFFMTGSSIIAIGRYANSVLTSKT